MSAPEDWIATAGPRPIDADPDDIGVPDAALPDQGLSLLTRGLYASTLTGQGRPINPYEDAIEDVEDIRAAIDELVTAGLVLRVVNPSGLSESPTEMYPELDLEGARVAFLVDGYPGGKNRRAALIAGGVPEERIAELGALTLENLLEPSLYLEAVRVLLGECNPGTIVPELPILPEPTTAVWPNELDRWAEQHSLKMPGKRVVASRLVEEGHAQPSVYGAPVLQELHKRLESLLKPHLASASSFHDQA